MTIFDGGTVMPLLLGLGALLLLWALDPKRGRR